MYIDNGAIKVYYNQLISESNFQLCLENPEINCFKETDNAVINVPNATF